MKLQNIKSLTIKGFGIKLAHMVTDENEVLQGVTVVVVHKTLLNIVLANANWVNDEGHEYGFAIDDKTLYIKRLAIGF